MLSKKKKLLFQLFNYSEHFNGFFFFFYLLSLFIFYSKSKCKIILAPSPFCFYWFSPFFKKQNKSVNKKLHLHLSLSKRRGFGFNESKMNIVSSSEHSDTSKAPSLWCVQWKHCSCGVQWKHCSCGIFNGKKILLWLFQCRKCWSVFKPGKKREWRVRELNWGDSEMEEVHYCN